MAQHCVQRAVHGCFHHRHAATDLSVSLAVRQLVSKVPQAALHIHSRALGAIVDPELQRLLQIDRNRWA
eukprot:244825-Chlamydomonas_euryale.AAC.1